jgi:hypothetical protein
MKKRDPQKHAKYDKQARKRAAYEKARKLKQKALKNSASQVVRTVGDSRQD